MSNLKSKQSVLHAVMWNLNGLNDISLTNGFEYLFYYGQQYVMLCFADLADLVDDSPLKLVGQVEWDAQQNDETLKRVDGDSNDIDDIMPD